MSGNDNQGLNFAGWVIGLVVLVPVVLIGLCCFGSSILSMIGAVE